jgi:hypothetical protein
MSTIAGFTTLVLVIASQGIAQQMSFAVYNDVSASGSGNTIYNYGSADDNSWGCSHWGYSTTVRLYSPSGRNSSRSGSLSANTSLAFADDSGNWGAVTQGTYNCSCMYGGTAGFGGGTSFYAGRYQGRYYNWGVYCPDGVRTVFLADACSHPCMDAQQCFASPAPYLWDPGLRLEIGPLGSCIHKLQASNQRGLCQWH